MKDTGGPAFPLVYDVPPENVRNVYQGMTLRDYFAAKAMQADMTVVSVDADFAWVAARAYKMADEMLRAREK